MKYQQISQEIHLLENHPSIKSIQKISTFEYHLIFVLKDEENVYSNHKWQILILLNQKYPYTPPKIKFETPIYHLNVDKQGWVHMGMIEEEWTQMGSLYTVIDQLQNILEYPDTNHPSDQQTLKLYINNRDIYTQKCLKHLLIKKPRASRIDSQGKQQLLQHINDLNKMRLTRFTGFQDDMKFTLPSNIKNHEVKLQTAMSDFFSGQSPIYKPQSLSQLKVSKVLKPVQVKISKKPPNLSQKQSEQLQNKQSKNCDMQFYQKSFGSAKQSPKKNIKESKQLISIAQSIRGQDASNIFDLSASKDQKFILSMKQSKLQGVLQTQDVFKSIEPRDQKEFNDLKGYKPAPVICKISQICQKPENNQKDQIRKKPLKRPDVFYENIPEKNSQPACKLIHKVSVELWNSVESICEIERNLRSDYVLKNKLLQKVLKNKLQTQLQNLQQLEELENQLKTKIITDLQKTILKAK